jgi:hypothetical protein
LTPALRYVITGSVSAMNEKRTYNPQSRWPERVPLQLWGHNKGQLVRADVEAELAKVEVGGAVHVDLGNVEMLDVSFALAAFGSVYSTMSSLHSGKALVLKNPSADVKENLHAGFFRVGLMALVVQNSGKWELIGKTSETDKPTLAALHKRKKATTPELSQDLSLNITTANQRLRKLAESGIIVRTKMAATSGGEQFMYEWPA